MHTIALIGADPLLLTMIPPLLKRGLTVLWLQLPGYEVTVETVPQAALWQQTYPESFFILDAQHQYQISAADGVVIVSLPNWDIFKAIHQMLSGYCRPQTAWLMMAPWIIESLPHDEPNNCCWVSYRPHPHFSPLWMEYTCAPSFTHEALLWIWQAVWQCPIWQVSREHLGFGHALALRLIHVASHAWADGLTPCGLDVFDKTLSYVLTGQCDAWSLWRVADTVGWDTMMGLYWSHQKSQWRLSEEQRFWPGWTTQICHTGYTGLCVGQGVYRYKAAGVIDGVLQMAPLGYYPAHPHTTPFPLPKKALPFYERLAYLHQIESPCIANIEIVLQTMKAFLRPVSYALPCEAILQRVLGIPERYAKELANTFAESLR